MGKRFAIKFILSVRIYGSCCLHICCPMKTKFMTKGRAENKIPSQRVKQPCHQTLFMYAPRSPFIPKQSRIPSTQPSSQTASPGPAPGQSVVPGGAPSVPRGLCSAAAAENRRGRRWPSGQEQGEGRGGRCTTANECNAFIK